MSDELNVDIAPDRTRSFTPFARSDIEQSIPSRFEQQVARFPDRIAVKTPRAQFTYAELNRTANRIARAILARRGEENEPVVLFMDQGALLIAAILGALKAAKAYVPLETSFPAGRNAAMLADSQARLLVTDARNMSLARDLASKSADVLNAEDLGNGFDGEDVRLNIPPSSIAYILYTSGSTGQPKGVFQSHRNVLHNVLRYTTSLQLTPEDRAVLLFSCSFAASVTDIFSTLMNGAGLFPFPLKEHGLGKLADWLIEQRMTICHCVTTLFRRFAETLTGREQFYPLRILKVSGESVYASDVELYRKHFPPSCSLVAGMGMTEMNTICQFFFDHHTELNGPRAPVGYPEADIETLVLDEDGRALDCGCEGEIAVKSEYLALGYWRRPDLTAAAFRADPSGSRARIYRTGDLGVKMADGCLFHLGRKDFQVKIRGHRAEIAEIELALHEVEGVQEAVVVARDGHDGCTQLLAYIAAPREPKPTSECLRRHLKEKVPGYMVPSAFHFLETLPLTATGKVDRMALSERGHVCAGPRTASAEARTPAESTIAAIWGEVLGASAAGVHDNFFDAGGDSLAAMVLIVRLERAFDLEVPIGVLIESPTIAGLAAHVESARSGGACEALRSPHSFFVPIQPAGSRPPVFLVPGGGGGDDEFFVYARLAHHVGRDFPIYGLRARSSDGKTRPHTCVEEMAADYVREVQRFLPEGPYRIIGECMGGIVAYEMARQLRAQGKTVALLLMMDTKRPTVLRYVRKCTRDGWRGLRESFRARVLDRLTDHWDASRELSWWRRVGYFWDNMWKAARVVSHVLNVTRMASTDARHETAKRIKRARIDYRHSLLRYRPKPYAGKVTMIVNEVSARNRPTLGWGDLARGGIELHRVPGRHSSYIREHAKTAAAQLRRCLESSSH